MVRWAEVKLAIREVCGPLLTPLGFPNPGYSMWRYREEFVDVIQFYHSGSGRTWFSIEFACQPRRLQQGHSGHPAPSSCIFRTRIQQTVDAKLPPELFSFAEDTDAQRQHLQALAPLIVEGSQRWFAQFISIASAIRALENNNRWSWKGDPLTNVFDGTKDSPAYQQAMTMLITLLPERSATEGG